MLPKLRYVAFINLELHQVDAGLWELREPGRNNTHTLVASFVTELHARETFAAVLVSEAKRIARDLCDPQQMAALRDELARARGGIV